MKNINKGWFHYRHNQNELLSFWNQGEGVIVESINLGSFLVHALKWSMTTMIVDGLLQHQIKLSISNAQLLFSADRRLPLDEAICFIHTAWFFFFLLFFKNKKKQKKIRRKKERTVLSWLEFLFCIQLVPVRAVNQSCN